MRLSALIIICGSIWITCGETPQLQQLQCHATDNPGWVIYIELRDKLEKSGGNIDYDTLMHTYQTMSQSEHEIAHMDRLLISLINKTNDNPRIDQMILICAAKTLGDSIFPVADADGVFETILKKDDRLTTWVLTFVAEAIGDYPIVIPEGDKLVDLLERKLSMVASTPDRQEEQFGRHFLPPPKGEYIQSYLQNIESANMRSKERRAYYELVARGYAEADIEKALRRLQSNGIDSHRKRPAAPMKHLVDNVGKLFR